jgi:hypothetical protein
MKFVAAPAIVVLLSLSVAFAPVASAADRTRATPSALTCDGAWHIATSDNPARTSELYGVAAVSSSLAWGVGLKYNSGTDRIRTLIERWDGTTWTAVPSPNSGHLVDELLGVAAADSTHAFAVGSRQPRSGRNRTLVEQYDGTSWSVVPSPNRGPGASFLSGVTAVAPNDVWAVGTHDLAPTAQAPLVEHWNGASWSVVPSPYFHHSVQTTLGDVSAVSANDVWAVGSYYSERRRGNFPLTEHWDGTAWSIVPAPSPGPDYVFSSVTALAPDDVWAVGLSVNGLVGGPLAEHWDGSAWSIVDAADLGRPQTEFFGVGAAGGSVYAVGLHNPGPEHTLAEQWNGTSFEKMATPNVGGAHFDNRLLAASSDGTTVWAVGDHGTHRGPHTLVEYVC